MLGACRMNGRSMYAPMISLLAWNCIIRVAASRYSRGMSLMGPNCRGPARSFTVARSIPATFAAPGEPVGPSMGRF